MEYLLPLKPPDTFDENYIEQIVKVTNLFLWDFKDGNTNRHKANTGVTNEKILHDLFLFDKLDVSILLRLPRNYILITASSTHQKYGEP